VTKQAKAIKKIGKWVHNATEMGVSAEVVWATVESALAASGGLTVSDPGLTDTPRTNGKKLVTRENPSLKKLPGKTKPPTLTLKNTSSERSAAPASKKAGKITGLNKQTDVTMKRG
jgi:hypothetical protein